MAKMDVNGTVNENMGWRWLGREGRQEGVVQDSEVRDEVGAGYEG